MKRLFLSIAILFFSWSVAHAQGIPESFWAACMPMKQAHVWLNSRGSQWKEAPVGRGVTYEGNMVEIFRDKDGKRWTILMTYPNTGNACITSRGFGWQDQQWLNPEGISN